MSNGTMNITPSILSAAKLSPADSATLTLLAIGTLILLIWIIVRVARRGKLSLKDTPSRPNSVNIFHIVGVFVVSLTCGSVVGIAAARLQGIDLTKVKPTPPTVEIPATMFTDMVMIVLSLAVGSMCFRWGIRKGLGLSSRRWLTDLTRAIVAFFLAIPLCYLAEQLMQWILPKNMLRVHALLEFIHRANPVWLVIAIITAVILAPLAEELFFRGLFQSMFRRLFNHPWWAILATSAIFAAAHYTQPKDLLALFVLSVVIGYNYERTGRLFSPILIHSLFNATNFIIYMLH